ncbi:hypothetical protein PROFUN_11518 [Planoprotostelium fungivorum]|uniref:SH2 domain-containing protein n=1 Tax=Planoprotostelium fungivorum TaxID=1890364 RepID=A0A2P6N9Z1_9EUKA|nr:hypothetical protein PROFUN_11518 [Planoprotostelium fungivorum]
MGQDGKLHPREHPFDNDTTSIDILVEVPLFRVEFSSTRSLERSSYTLWKLLRSDASDLAIFKSRVCYAADISCSNEMSVSASWDKGGALDACKYDAMNFSEGSVTMQTALSGVLSNWSRAVVNHSSTETGLSLEQKAIGNLTDPESEAATSAAKLCGKILEQFKYEQTAGGGDKKPTVDLTEYITIVQFVLFTLDHFLATPPKKRSKVIFAPLLEATKGVAAVVDQLSASSEVFKRTLSSHRMSVRLEQGLFTMYREAFQIHLMDEDNANRRKSKSATKHKKSMIAVQPNSFTTTDFSSHIIDTVARAFWNEHFGVNYFLVSWVSMSRSLLKSCDGVTEENIDNIQCVLDPSRTNFVSVYRFNHFITIFGPLKESSRKALHLVQSPHFQGHMSHTEAIKLLFEEPLNTFVTRLSKTKPDRVIISYVAGELDPNVTPLEPKISNITLYGSPGGYTTENLKQGKSVTHLEEVLGERYAYQLDLMRTEYFFGDMTEQEAVAALQQKSKGTFLVRFEQEVKGNCDLVVSLVTPRRDGTAMIEHYSGLKIQSGQIKYKSDSQQRTFPSLHAFLERIHKVGTPLNFFSLGTVDDMDMPWRRNANNNKWFTCLEFSTRETKPLCGVQRGKFWEIRTYVSSTTGGIVFKRRSDEPYADLPDLPGINIECEDSSLWMNHDDWECALSGIDDGGMKVQSKSHGSTTSHRDPYGKLPDLGGMEIAEPNDRQRSSSPVLFLEKPSPHKFAPYGQLPPILDISEAPSSSTSSRAASPVLSAHQLSPRKEAGRSTSKTIKQYGELPKLTMTSGSGLKVVGTKCSGYAELPPLTGDE